MKKKTKRLLEHLGHKKLRKALKQILRMRSALRAIHILAEYADGYLLSRHPRHVIDTCRRGLRVKT